MADHLTQFLFESHGAGWPEAGRPVSLRPGHVVLDEDTGVVALLAFEALGGGRTRCPVALVGCAREAAGPDAVDDQRYLRTAAAALGLWFARPGAAGAGALGVLALAATPLECAAALAGRPLARPRPRVVGVRLANVLPAGAGGAEALESLVASLGRDLAGAVIEYFGDGVASLPMAERIAMAALAPRRLGVLASVFPADDATRDYLAARGREADWRRFAGAEVFERTVALDLAAVAPPRAPEGATVRVGPFAEDDDLRTLADALGERPPASGGTVQVVTGGRAARAALEADGTLERLARAGVALLDSGDAEAGAPPGEGALACADEEALEAGATPVSMAALAARLAPAAERGARTIAAPGSAALDPAELLAPAEAPEPIERAASHRVPAPLPALAGGLRGEVLLRAEGRVGCAEILPWGPRVRARRGDPAALAELWGRGLDPDAAARGIARGGGFVVAGGEYGAGEPAEAAASATAALGVRAVLAPAFAPRHASALVRCGVVPLRFVREGDAANVAAGDELEMPMLAERLASGSRVTVRHLTRGLSFTVVHDLDDGARELVRAGGLLGLGPAAEGA